MISERARARRRQCPIISYIGHNSSGKTLGMVHDTLPSLDAGRPVLSTVRFLDFRKPRPCEESNCPYPGHPEHGQAHPLWVPFTSFEQMLDLTDCDVVMDEVTGVAGARDTSSLPSIVSDAFKRQRAAERVVRWSAPSWADGDVQLRRVTQAVTVCRGFWRRPNPERLWPQYRAFFWRTYDVRGIAYDAVEQLAAARTKQAATGRVRPLVREVAWDVLDAMHAYDTFGQVLRVGNDVVTGRCLSCGGTPPRKVCHCHDEDAPVATTGASAVRPGRGARQLAVSTGRRALPATTA